MKAFLLGFLAGVGCWFWWSSPARANPEKEDVPKRVPPQPKPDVTMYWRE